jgi:triacylglycerol lipase
VLAGLPPARRRTLLIAAALLLVVSAAAAVRVSLRGSGSRVAPVAQGAAGPVLLVPGYGGATSGLAVLAAQLRGAGRNATILELPDGGVGDLASQARALGGLARSTLARTGARTLDVVGYSAGGVVARLWVRDYGGGRLARRVVTLGSPQHGTTLAELGSLLPGNCPPACQQLRPDSDLLAALNAGAETPAGPTFVSIWTTHDDVVLPVESARLTGAAVNLAIQTICPGDDVRHSGLPSDPSVRAVVLVELAPGPPTAPTGASCRG